MIIELFWLGSCVHILGILIYREFEKKNRILANWGYKIKKEKAGQIWVACSRRRPVPQNWKNLLGILEWSRTLLPQKNFTAKYLNASPQSVLASG